MLTLRSIRIALAITCSVFLFGMVNNSLAIEIVDFPSDTEDTSYNGYTYHMAYVETDTPIFHVSWYIDDEPVHCEMLNSSTNYASYYPYDKIPGIIKGKKYKIGVEVWGWDAEEFRDTSDSYNVRMFQPIELYRKGTNTGAIGYAQISRLYYNGSHIVMDSYAHASNPSDNPKAGDRDEFELTVASWFRTDEYDAPNGSVLGTQHRDTKPLQTIDLGETSDTSYPGPYRQEQIGGPDICCFDRDIGVLTKGGEPRYFNAHTHLVVSATIRGLLKEDHWEVDTKQQTGTTAVTFTWEDGP